MRILIILFLFISFSINAQHQIVVYFDSNQFQLNPIAKAKLDSLFINTKNIEITKIHGFCDNLDSNNHNQLLSLSRAKEVQNYANSQQITFAKTIEIKGFGEQFQLNKTASKNRKAIIYFIKKRIFSNNKPKPAEYSNFESNEIIEFDVEESKKSLTDKIINGKKEEVIVFQDLHFYLNSEKLIPQSQPLLAHLLQILTDNPKFVIGIRGHICCNPDANNITLSSRRAKYIFDYLIKNGIKTNKLAYKGYGSSQPIYKLPEKNAAEEQANRRIELVIISNNYKSQW